MSESNNRIASEDRIPMLDAEEAARIGKTLGIDEYIARMNFFRVLLNFPDVAVQISQLIMALVKNDAILSHRLRELIIMRISWLHACEYAWWQHWQASLWLGLSEAELHAVQDWTSASCFNRQDQLVLKATDETLATGFISSVTWKELQAEFTDVKALIAIVASIGNWNMSVQLLRSLAVPLEPGSLLWPPHGTAPKVKC